MAKTRLTDRFIRALRPTGAATVDYRDAEVPGLVLRATPQGVKSFGLRFTFQGRDGRKSYGPYPEVTLARARDLARVDRQGLRDGIDPNAAPAVASPVPTFGQMVERWKAAKLAKGHRQVGAAYGVLRRYAMPTAEVWPDLADRETLTLEHRPIDQIRRKDIVRILEWMRDRVGVKAMVNRVHKTISGVFTYALKVGEIDHHPLVKLEPFIVERERERILTIEELVAVWRASDHLGPEAGGAVKLLILSAQRRSEVSGLRRRELCEDGALWILPAARRKQDGKHSKGDHLVPLSAAARAVLTALPVWIDPDDDHVFGVKGRRPYAGWRQSVEQLRQLAGLKEHWTLHDLRRSAATAWGEQLNMPEELINRALGHSRRAKIGETARYERSKRLGELRKLYDSWGKFFMAKVTTVSNGGPADEPLSFAA
jgi:integrase